MSLRYLGPWDLGTPVVSCDIGEFFTFILILKSCGVVASPSLITKGDHLKMDVSVPVVVHVVGLSYQNVAHLKVSNEFFYKFQR